MPLPYKSIVIDTEGSGLFDYKKPADADGQPRLAALAMIYVDENLAIERRELFLVKPVGWVMTAGATEVNGLTTDYLMANGQPVAKALDAFMLAIHEGRCVIAYGAQHDLKQMRGELRRAERVDLFEGTRNLCMMRAMNGVCKKTQPDSNRRRWPKLWEAMDHFHIPFDAGDRHTAMGDADACLTLFRKGVEIGLKLEPEVHHAVDGSKAGEALKARGGKPKERQQEELPIEPRVPRREAPAADLASQDIPE